MQRTHFVPKSSQSTTSSPVQEPPQPSFMVPPAPASSSQKLPGRTQKNPSQALANGPITPSQFMAAFHQAVRLENGERAENDGSEHSNLPFHVKKRIEEWGQISYRQRIAEAFLRAGNHISRTISSPETFNKVLYLSIPINKNGSLGDISSHTFSGIPDLDQYMVKVLKTADFPPIPDRFNTDIFLLTLPITISLKPGTKTYHIHVGN